MGLTLLLPQAAALAEVSTKTLMLVEQPTAATADMLTVVQAHLKTPAEAAEAAEAALRIAVVQAVRLVTEHLMQEHQEVNIKAAMQEALTLQMAAAAQVAAAATMVVEAVALLKGVLLTQAEPAVAVVRLFTQDHYLVLQRLTV